MNINIIRSGSIVYMHIENINGTSFTFGAPRENSALLAAPRPKTLP